MIDRFDTQKSEFTGNDVLYDRERRLILLDMREVADMLNKLTAERNKAMGAETHYANELVGVMLQNERLEAENQQLRAELSGNNAAWDMLVEAGMGAE